MKTCKVKPERSVCQACMSLSNSGFVYPSDCMTCNENTDVYELLEVGVKPFWGNFAMVMKDGRIRRVSLDRVYDVKDVD